MADKILPTRETAIAVRPESLPTPADKTELRGLRSTHGKQFLHPEKAPNGDNIITCETRMGAVCYRDDNGELRSIDTTVRDLDGVIGVEWAPYKMHLHDAGIGFDFWSREGGEVSIKLTGIGGEKFDQDAPLKPDITENIITFRDVRPGCDIVFTCLNQRVKTLRILHDDKAPRTFEWSVASDKPELIDSTLIGWDAANNPLECAAKIVTTDDGDEVTETWTGRAKLIADPVTRIRSWGTDVTWPVTIDPTVSSSVSAGSDDGWERTPSGSYWYGTAGYLQLGYFGSGHNIGLHLPLVNVPQGSTINSATLTMQANYVYGGGGAGKIYCEADDNPAVFSSSKRPAAVTKTTAFTSTGTVSSTGSKTFNVASAVQEVVSRGGFAANNAINIPIIRTTGGGGAKITRFDSYEASGSNQASLSITYTAGGGGGTSQNLLLLGCG